jgi:Peptidase family M28
LFDVPVISITLGVFEALAYKQYDPHHLAPPTTPYVRDWYNNMPPAPDNLQTARAAAAIGILDLGPGAAEGLYTPYDGLIRAVPGIYVDRMVGAQLRQVAASDGKVRVELGAHVANVNGRNLLGIIPGATKELVAINCHTDGTNGLEDNGPIAIVAIAQYLARIPRHRLPRTVLVLLTTGHFAGGIGARTFISHHRHDLVPQITAAVTIEHLGAQEWLPNTAGELQATGNPEPGAVFGAPNRAPLDAATSAVAHAQAAPTFIIPPLYRNPHRADNYAAWPGGGLIPLEMEQHQRRRPRRKLHHRADLPPQRRLQGERQDRLYPHAPGSARLHPDVARSLSHSAPHSLPNRHPWMIFQAQH